MSPGNVKCRSTSTNSKRRYSRQAREIRSSASGVDRSVVFPTAVAQRHGVMLLHYQPDYDLIAELTGQDAEWVVPPGSLP